MSNPDYKVADLGLAKFGRSEIQLAEAEMPALMALPLQMATSAGCLNMTERFCLSGARRAKHSVYFRLVPGMLRRYQILRSISFFQRITKAFWPRLLCLGSSGAVMI